MDLMEIQGVFNIMKQLTNLRLIVFGPATFLSDANVVKILEYATPTSVSMIVFPDKVCMNGKHKQIPLTVILYSLISV